MVVPADFLYWYVFPVVRSVGMVIDALLLNLLLTISANGIVAALLYKYNYADCLNFVRNMYTWWTLVQLILLVRLDGIDWSTIEINEEEMQYSEQNNDSNYPQSLPKDKVELTNRDMNDVISPRYNRIGSHERNSFWSMRKRMVNLQSIIAKQKLMQR